MSGPLDNVERIVDGHLPRELTPEEWDRLSKTVAEVASAGTFAGVQIAEFPVDSGLGQQNVDKPK